MPPKRRTASHPNHSGLASETVKDSPTLLIPSSTDGQGARRATSASASPTDTQIANRIIKFLERCSAVGRRQDEVYSDWLQFVDALLDQEEPNIIALATTGAFAEDPPGVTTLLERLRKTYPHREGAKLQYLDYFLKAYAELRVSPEYGYVTTPPTEAGGF